MFGTNNIYFVHIIPLPQPFSSTAFIRTPPPYTNNISSTLPLLYEFVESCFFDILSFDKRRKLTFMMQKLKQEQDYALLL